MYRTNVYFGLHKTSPVVHYITGVQLLYIRKTGGIDHPDVINPQLVSPNCRLSAVLRVLVIPVTTTN